MTDPTYAALLARVLETPEDDVPRLVLADWLEENAEPERAEFVRAQCELATMPLEVNALEEAKVGGLFPLQKSREGVRWKGRPITAEEWDRLHHCAALCERERELFENGLAHRWGFPNAIYCTPFPGDYTKGLGAGVPVGLIRRGFIEHVTCDLATFMGGPCGRCNGRGWYDREPGDGEMSCFACSGTGRTPGIAPRLFASQPVTRVTLTGDVDLVAVAALLNLPFFARSELPTLSDHLVAHGRANAEGHRHGVCGWCAGTGASNTRADGSAIDKCPDCDGTGTKPGLPPLAVPAPNNPTPAEV